MCTRPLKGYVIGVKDNGKKRIAIRPYSSHHLEIMPTGNIITCFDDTTNLSNKPIHEFIEIPCGKCLECKLKYSRDWANRCMLEAQQYQDNCFITLTYDEEHLPKKFNEKHNKEFMTLCKNDIQKFIKDLRNHVNYSNEFKRYLKEDDPGYINIRYYLCGEYGEKFKRPHYHVLLFNYKPDDLVPVSKNFQNDVIYESNFISQIWNKGMNAIAEVSWESCSYVSRYVSKKLGVTNDNIYDDFGIEKEFVLMSRRPGIGSNWYNSKNVCYANFTNNYISTKKGSIKITSNKYFDKLLERDNPEVLEELKEKRKEFAIEKKKLLMESTSLPYLEQLKVNEKKLLERTKILKRKDY